MATDSSATAYSAVANRVSGRGVRSLRRGAAITATAILITAGLAAPASAAPGLTDDGTTEANVIVQSAIVLSGLTPSFTLVGIPGATVTAGGAVTMNVVTNNFAGYAVTVVSETDSLLPATAGNTDEIPIAALSVREAGATTWTPLSDTTPVQTHTQGTRSAQDGDTINNEYQVVIPFVNEDTYTATLDYVATTL